MLQWLAYRREPRRENIAWSNLFLAGCSAAGGAWGAAAVIAFPQGDIAAQAFLSFLIAGVSAGAVTTLAVDRRNVLSFVLPCVLPLAVRLSAESGIYAHTMAVMVFLYAVVIVAAGCSARATCWSIQVASCK